MDGMKFLKKVRLVFPWFTKGKTVIYIHFIYSSHVNAQRSKCVLHPQPRYFVIELEY